MKKFQALFHELECCHIVHAMSLLMNPRFHPISNSGDVVCALHLAERRIIFSLWQDGCVPGKVQLLRWSIGAKAGVEFSVLELYRLWRGKRGPVTLFEARTELAENPAITMRRDAHASDVMIPRAQDAADNARADANAAISLFGPLLSFMFP